MEEGKERFFLSVQKEIEGQNVMDEGANFPKMCANADSYPPSLLLLPPASLSP